MAKDTWIGSAVKHPGDLTEAAKRNGRSKEQEAEVESHSSDPSIRSRGNLGKRFMGIAKKGNIKKPHQGKLKSASAAKSFGKGY